MRICISTAIQKDIYRVNLSAIEINSSYNSFLPKAHGIPKTKFTFNRIERLKNIENCSCNVYITESICWLLCKPAIETAYFSTYFEVPMGDIQLDILIEPTESRCRRW